jgi:hypothetical protein
MKYVINIFNRVKNVFYPGEWSTLLHGAGAVQCGRSCLFSVAGGAVQPADFISVNFDFTSSSISAQFIAVFTLYPSAPNPNAASRYSARS